MRGTIRWAVGLIVVLTGVIGLSQAKDDEGYDLRGPAPKKGQILLTTSVFKIKGGNIAVDVGGMKFEGMQSLTATEESETKAVAVDGRQITKAQTKVTKEQAESEVSIGGNDMNDTKTGELTGETIISERTGAGKWKHSLVDTKPTAKQSKELEKRVGPESDDALYPEGKVKVGHTWTVEASALQRVFGGSISDLKGTLKMKFVKVEMVNGEQCAVIEAAGKIKGTAKMEEGSLDVELDMKGTTWRSLKSGVDVKDKAEGKLKMTGSIDAGGMKVDIQLDGPFSIESTAKLK